VNPEHIVALFLRAPFAKSANFFAILGFQLRRRTSLALNLRSCSGVCEARHFLTDSSGRSPGVRGRRTRGKKSSPIPVSCDPIRGRPILRVFSVFFRKRAKNGYTPNHVKGVQGPGKNVKTCSGKRFKPLFNVKNR
jgi:hypothetical protein